MYVCMYVCIYVHTQVIQNCPTFSRIYIYNGCKQDVKQRKKKETREVL